MSCKVIAQSWMTSDVVKDAVDLSYTSLMGSASAAISLSHSVNITKGGKHSSSTFKTLFRGGDFAVYKDQEAWRQTVEKTPILQTYELAPIYELIRPDDKKYNASSNILIAAVNRAVKKFDGNIPNYDSVPSIVLLPALHLATGSVGTIQLIPQRPLQAMLYLDQDILKINPFQLSRLTVFMQS